MTRPKSLNCEQVIQLVIDHLEATPEAPLSEEIQEHLRACSECYRHVELERRLHAKDGRQLSCEEVIELLFDYLDQEVDEVLNSRIERHLETCRDCFSRVGFERRLRERVRDSGTAKAPDRLHRRIKSVLERF